MKFVWYLIIAWLLYQFIFKLVIPVYRTSRQIKKGFKEMHTRMQQQQSSTTGHQSNDLKQKPAARPDPKDYIEFEEIQN